MILSFSSDSSETLSGAISNPSGIVPLDLKVLIRPDPIDMPKGGLTLPDAVVEQRKQAQTKATVVAVGCNAFSEWGSAANKPSTGSRVIYGKYSGARTPGIDGQDYIVCDDKDVLAIIREA